MVGFQITYFAVNPQPLRSKFFAVYKPFRYKPISFRAQQRVRDDSYDNQGEQSTEGSCHQISPVAIALTLLLAGLRSTAG